MLILLRLSFLRKYEKPNDINGCIVKSDRLLADAASNAIDIAIKIGEKIYELGKIGIETLKDAFHAVESFFNMVGNVGEGVQDVIDWLKRTFAFKDMCNTKRAIDQALSMLKPSLTPILTSAHEYFNKAFLDQLPSIIDEAFVSMGGRFERTDLGDLKFTDGTPSFLVRAGEAVMYIEEIAQMIIDPVANWLWDNYLNKWVTLIADALPSVLLPSFEPLQGPMKALFEAFNAALQEFESVFGVLYEWLKSKLQQEYPKDSVKHTLFNDALQLLRQISLGGVTILHKIIDALYAALVAAVNLIDKFLNAEVNLGVIQTVWQFIQDHAGIVAADQAPLTLGGLFSLIMAAPATVLYKLIFGNDKQPFPHGLPTAMTERSASSPAVAALADPTAGDAMIALARPSRCLTCCCRALAICLPKQKLFFQKTGRWRRCAWVLV